LKTDPFRPARSLALYDWPEELDFSKNIGFLLDIESDINIMPCKIGISDNVKKRNSNRSVNNGEKLLNLIEKFGSFDSFQFTRPIEKNYINPEIQVSLARKPYCNYHVQKNELEFALIDVVRHVTTFCKKFTPEYGFATVLPSFESFWFCGGVSTTSMDAVTTKRASAIDELRLPVGTPFPIKGRFHDIYELNVLSPKHLDREVFGQPLTKWIAQGGRGELVPIKKGVTLWLVPDDIRPRIRELFFKAGLLLVPV
jgi:hypothetical protein